MQPGLHRGLYKLARLAYIGTFAAPRFESYNQKRALALPEFTGKLPRLMQTSFFANDSNRRAGVPII